MVIEFKCWNVEEKIMHDVAFPSWNGAIEVWADNVPQGKIQYLSNGPAEEGVLLQFICHDATMWDEAPEKEQKAWLNSGMKPEQWRGLKIHNGDIVEYFLEHIRVGGEWEPNIKRLVVEIKPGLSSNITHILNSGLKRIGNIYENPELLK